MGSSAVVIANAWHYGQRFPSTHVPEVMGWRFAPGAASGRTRSLQIARLHGLKHGAGAVAHAEFGQDAGDMILDRAFAGADSIGDFLVVPVLP